MDDINDIKANETYMLIYIRHKTDEEIKIEKDVSEQPSADTFVPFTFIYYFYDAILTKFVCHLQILAQEINNLREEEGEKSNRMSPRRFQMKKFENQGIKIKECKKIIKTRQQ